ncbi:MAG: hypothetical protein R3344_05510 [Acidobacteriota bacterium]|nr:hypothetical protein [Acidobacteriota bacterium]
MAKHMRLLAFAVVVVLAFTGVLAQDTRDLPHRYSPRLLDGTPVVVTDELTGTAWSAWTYRLRGESDIALSFRDANGTWSEPVFIGVGDRLDQVEPALALDARGNFYLVFAVGQTGSIHATALGTGRTDWFSPTRVTGPDELASSPSLRVVDDRLVMAYRVGREVRIVDWQLLGAFNPNGTQEGPNGFPTMEMTPQPEDDPLPDEEDETRRSGGFRGNDTPSSGG